MDTEPSNQDKVIYITLPRHQRQGTLSKQLDTYINDFAAFEETFKGAVTTFREALRVQPDTCDTAIEILQAVRKQAKECLDFIRGYSCHVTVPTIFDELKKLDGSDIAQLILELDAFKSLCTSKTRTKTRITTHVHLQMSLSDVLKHLQELLKDMRELPQKQDDFEELFGE